MPHDFDIAVVGGGLAGTAVALALAPLGCRVAAIEARERRPTGVPHYDDRALALAAGSCRILADVGVWARAEPDAEPIRRVHVSERGRAGIAVLTAAEIALEALGWVVEGATLSGALDAALDAAPVERIQPAELVALADDGDAVTLELDAGGVMRSVRARLVVGADGADSAVRRLAGIGATERRYGQTAIVANFTPAAAHRGTAWERFTPDGPLAVLPLPGRRCGLVWTVAENAAERVIALDDRAFAAAVDARFGHRLGAIERVGRRQAWPLTRTIADAQVRGRVALVGNAAHGLHPIAGQGFNLTLRDCRALAAAVADALQAGGDPAAPDALRAWAATRAADQRRVGTFVDGLNTLFSIDLPGAGALRGAGIALFGLMGPVRRLLARYGAGTAPSLR